VVLTAEVSYKGGLRSEKEGRRQDAAPDSHGLLLSSGDYEVPFEWLHV
jgi:hypothetical protein